MSSLAFYLITPTILTFPIAWIVSCFKLIFINMVYYLLVFLLPSMLLKRFRANSSPSYSGPEFAPDVFRGNLQSYKFCFRPSSSGMA